MKTNTYNYETRNIHASEDSRRRPRRARLLQLAIAALLASVLTAGCSNMLTDLSEEGDSTEPGSWNVVGSKAFSDDGAGYTDIAIDSNGTPHVVYQDLANSEYATVMKYDNGSWSAVGSKGFSDVKP